MIPVVRFIAHMRTGNLECVRNLLLVVVPEHDPQAEIIDRRIEPGKVVDPFDPLFAEHQDLVGELDYRRPPVSLVPLCELEPGVIRRRRRVADGRDRDNDQDRKNDESGADKLHGAKSTIAVNLRMAGDMAQDYLIW